MSWQVVAAKVCLTTSFRRAVGAAAIEAKAHLSATADEAKAQLGAAADEAKAQLGEAKEKAAEMANAAAAAANEAKEKAMQIFSAVGDSVEHGKKQVGIAITVVGVNWAKMEHQVTKLTKLLTSALPAPAARTVGECDDEFVQWKRCRRCQVQFDPSAPWEEGMCRFHPARWECGTGEGPLFARRHVFGGDKCADECSGRFPCCGVTQRLSDSVSTGCRNMQMHVNTD